MTKCCVFIAFFMIVTLFSPVSVQAGNVSDISDEQSKEVSHTIMIGSEKVRPFGFENKSRYDLNCDCGYWTSRGCYYDANDEKVCDCNWGYSQNGDKCERCDCGIYSSKCYFENYQKKCSCLSNYLQNKYGECEDCNCGIYSSGCRFENDQKKCSCPGKYIQNSYGKCEECDCGYDSENCSFSGYNKECTCRAGYIVESGKCEKCDCGVMSTSCELTFDLYTRCTCKSGYVAERSTWEMNEMCKLPGPSGWKIATYIESAVFGLIIFACTITIFCKSASS